MIKYNSTHHRFGLHCQELINKTRALQIQRAIYLSREIDREKEKEREREKKKRQGERD